MEKRKKNFVRTGTPKAPEAPAFDKDMIFGTRAVIEAIRSGKEVESLLIQKDLQNELIQELKATAAEHGVTFVKVPAEKLNRVTRKNHQGVVCFLSPITYASLDNIVNSTFAEGRMPLLLILDRVTDVRNFGAIARTAECMGVDALVIPSRGNARIGSDAVKTSAGALHYIPVCREANLKDTLRYLKDSGIQLIACTEKAEKESWEASLQGPLALIMGSEEDGISPEYLKLADEQIKIPLRGQIASLNVSVASAMCLYEVDRQRRLS
ncbi:23S rRNA (guanosine(2251)-2'-O)-methyltransferase RlmB [Nafulsella turpanensis]|uniref:23S rRNA (guanosine(2251)-2'-O)-methyltransferase RlmB n=1 Tax=Nafulsella turpanensis TaxID=1265690 RepID=UPI0003493492|nr:23S rRNA (guanosine(2251)-2'-O)-methyltransferase RlmB [Nafulsella turpanensis]